MLNIENIKQFQKNNATLLDDPYLPRGKAISLLRQACQHLESLLNEVGRLQALIVKPENQLEL